MKQLVVRGMVTLGLVASLGVGMTAVASAGGNPSSKANGTTSEDSTLAQKFYHQQLSAYHASRNAIEATFRASVAAAVSIYNKALLAATTSAERSTAEQNKVTAVIQAAQIRSAALTALGHAPTPPTT